MKSLNKVVKNQDISQIVSTSNLYEFTAYYVYKAAGFYVVYKTLLCFVKAFKTWKCGWIFIDIKTAGAVHVGLVTAGETDLRRFVFPILQETIFTLIN